MFSGTGKNRDDLSDCDENDIFPDRPTADVDMEENVTPNPSDSFVNNCSKESHENLPPLLEDTTRRSFRKRKHVSYTYGNNDSDDSEDDFDGDRTNSDPDNSDYDKTNLDGVVDGSTDSEDESGKAKSKQKTKSRDCQVQKHDHPSLGAKFVADHRKVNEQLSKDSSETFPCTRQEF